MATFRVTVEIIDAYNTSRPLLIDKIKVEDFGDVGDHALAIAILTLVDGAECPFDCDTCKEED